MLPRQRVFRTFFSVADVVILILIGAVIAGIASTASQWRGDYSPVTYIDLSPRALPRYVVLSAARGFAAYLLSLFCALTFGYWAAKSRRARAVILPLVDIFQAIPVLGFLPGLVLGLITLFPHSNLGLELSAVIMIFTSQAWNMIFSFYSSVRSVPPDLEEAASIIGLGRLEKFLRLELPFGAVDLAWNSVLSVAGGWFFLSVCEAFSLGDKHFRLPGIGSYMDVAITQGNTEAMILGIVAMTVLIISIDFFIWRPILAWVKRFRYEETTGLVGGAEPMMQIWMRESHFVRWVKSRYYHYMTQYRWKPARDFEAELARESSPGLIVRALIRVRTSLEWVGGLELSPWTKRVLATAVLGGIGYLLVMGTWRLIELWLSVSQQEWILLLRDTFWSLLRVLLAVFISTIWSVPVGVWIATSQRRIRVAQPIIQILASFPDPMLYPLALGLFLSLGIRFEIGSVFLITLGVQWYVLFNVLAGGLRIPDELRYALDLMKAPKWERWKRLYLPSIFPALVTGWVTAAGGGWNSTIVAEYILYKNQVYRTAGLGTAIREAADSGDLGRLAAGLTLMVASVMLFNRLVWERIYRIAQTRYRLDV